MTEPANPWASIDVSHLGRHITGIERVTIHPEAPGRFNADDMIGQNRENLDGQPAAPAWPDAANRLEAGRMQAPTNIR